MERNYNIITFFQKTFVLRRHGVAYFPIKIAIILLKQSFKSRKKPK